MEILFNPLKIELGNKRVSKVSCGWDHFLFLDFENNLFSSGDNKNGQLGLKEKKKYLNIE